MSNDAAKTEWMKSKGYLLIDPKKCSGCMSCMMACKYKPTRIAYDFEKRIAMKCDLCDYIYLIRKSKAWKT